MFKKPVLGAAVTAVALTGLIAGAVPSAAFAKHRTAAQIQAQREARERQWEEDKAACEQAKKDSKNKGAVIGALAGAVGGNVISGKKSKGMAPSPAPSSVALSAPRWARTRSSADLTLERNDFK